MGRRKSKRKPPPKKKMTGNLDVQFTCPFCNHEKSCDVKMPVNMTENKKKLRVLQVNLRTPKMCKKKSLRSSNVDEDSVPTGSKFNSTNSVACFLFKEL
ncbi:Transcription elongation factor 1 like [Dissostichus eleginoides]|uniref:Transcription elongation factor 1 homolog n=1 Tax=Dissostichus eleginoides TaxID=100907 RepID=A0AAD9EUP3_DISEL|nr:Transcription elongation factor 1 like [Dissostichus eleginoides]